MIDGYVAEQIKNNLSNKNNSYMYCDFQQVFNPAEALMQSCQVQTQQVVKGYLEETNV